MRMGKESRVRDCLSLYAREYPKMGTEGDERWGAAGDDWKMEREGKMERRRSRGGCCTYTCCREWTRAPDLVRSSRRRQRRQLLASLGHLLGCDTRSTQHSSSSAVLYTALTSVRFPPISLTNVYIFTRRPTIMCCFYPGFIHTPRPAFRLLVGFPQIRPVTYI